MGMSVKLPEPEFDVVVIGGGVVGLSVGYYCAVNGLSTAVVERHERFCEEASTHNSGVLHSGFSSEPGTMKAELNATGIRLMYEKAQEWKFRTLKTGTLVAARNEAEGKRLREIKAAGERNGVSGLRLLSAGDVRDVEPEIEGVTSALYSPEGGVLDIMEYTARLQAHASTAGAVLAKGRGVSGLSVRGDSVQLSLADGEVLSSRYVVNSAGIHADDVAAMVGSSYKLYPCVGEYAYVVGRGSGMIRGMVYPVVEEHHPGLGIHLTRTIDGQLQVGPTAVYGLGKDPTVWKRTPLSVFAGTVRSFLPGVPESDVREGWYGVRAKLVGPDSGRGFGDFVVEWDKHGHPAIHLVGIESPGLTASLAIGKHVADMIHGKSGGVGIRRLSG